MPLNFKKVTTADAIASVENSIAYHKKSIAFLKSLSKSGNKKELIEWVNQRIAILQKGINDRMGNPTFKRILDATSLTGELRGLKSVVNLFENVDMVTLPDEQQLQMWQQELKKLKELPTREK